MTHIPNNQYCETFVSAKMFKVPSLTSGGSKTIAAEKFGDHLTADHLILHRDNEAEIEGARLALVVKDVASGFLYAYPSGRKSKDECYKALLHFTSKDDEVGNFYSDNAKEISSAVEELGWRHVHSREFIHQSNAKAESNPCRYGGHQK